MGNNNIKATVSETLRSTAGAIEKSVERSDPESGIAGYGRQASALLNQSADYLQDITMQQVIHDVEEQIRRNPGSSVLIAGVAGLLLGVILRRR